MNRTKSQLICSQHTYFFSRRQEQIGDKLGLNSFLVKPIQRLPHYKMLFNQMIVELLKNMDDESLKPLIAICCKTEKYVQKLLDTVNESININDIEECYEVRRLSLPSRKHSLIAGHLFSSSTSSTRESSARWTVSISTKSIRITATRVACSCSTRVWSTRSRPARGSSTRATIYERK